MPNPFYTPNQKQKAIGISTKSIILFAVLLFIKLVPTSPCASWSWWIITLPITLPIAILVFVVFGILLLKVVEGFLNSL
ncbi:MAG: hypothetical protein PHQ74_15055 [Crocinitomicaceae bacterium]|nr:hypothetical protein [Crocinitomicaceae bacterium]